MLAARPSSDAVVRAALAAGAAILAWHPALWLWGTWTDPAYASGGGLAALGVAALALWSLASPRLDGSPAAPPPGVVACLAATALLRLLSEGLGVNLLGAATLAVDVAALAAWAGLDRRRRALSPLWLGALFALALPLERALQRVLGFPLQQVSAAGACGLLGLGDPSVRCEGVRIVVQGREALVDLPCSGANGLVVLLTLFAASAALARPTPARALLGLALALAAALAANALRIAALALGIAHGERLGFDVLSAPWHEAIGLGALGLGALPVLLWARATPAPPAAPAPLSAGRPWSPVARRAALACPALALLVLAVPARPVDVARPIPSLVLPARLGEAPARPEPLGPQEAAYFTRYGGAAARARYGEATLTLVRSTAPLRHLHAPDECLRGAGHRVRHVGTRLGPLPTATYRAEAPDGAVWRVEVSFVSERGERAAGIGEAVWRWLAAPGTAWTMVQRATPWDHPSPGFEAALRRALDLPDAAPAAPASPA